MSLLVLFFFLMLFMPQVYQGPRAILLLLLLLLSFRQKVKISLNSKVWTMWLLTFLVAIYAFIIGLIRGNVGLWSCVPFYIVWPILFLYFIIRCNTIDKIKILLKTIIYGGLIVAVFNFVLILNAFLLHIEGLNALGKVLLCMFNIQKGFAEYFSPSANHLIYVIYFCVSLLLLKPQTFDVKKKYLYFCIAISVIDVVLSNRRAMWLLLVMLPFILVVILSFLPYHKKILVKVGTITILSGILVFGIMYYFLDLRYVIHEFVTSFDFSGKNESNLERTLQVKSLWNDFLVRPILGGGIGLVSGYVRTPKSPWGYEMTYNYILAMVGIVGTLIYILTTYWIYNKAIKLSKKRVEYASLLIPQILGLVALLIMSASNPYIVTFDFVWAIYLPVATINSIWNERRKENKNLSIS